MPCAQLRALRVRHSGAHALRLASRATPLAAPVDEAEFPLARLGLHADQDSRRTQGFARIRESSEILDCASSPRLVVDRPRAWRVGARNVRPARKARTTHAARAGWGCTSRETLRPSEGSRVEVVGVARPGCPATRLARPRDANDLDS